MAHLNARRPNLPAESAGLLDALTKAELLEIAWHFASRCTDETCDDHNATRRAIIDEANHLRAQRQAARVKL